MNKGRGDQQGLEKDVEIEDVVVSDSDAIVDPGTVVVKSLNTVPTDGAVSAATRTNGIAVRAELSALNLFKHVHEVDLIVLKVAWLRAGCASEEEHAGSDEKYVKSYLP